jgi:hypothetical protein
VGEEGNCGRALSLHRGIAITVGHRVQEEEDGRRKRDPIPLPPQNQGSDSVSFVLLSGRFSVANMEKQYILFET